MNKVPAVSWSLISSLLPSSLLLPSLLLSNLLLSSLLLPSLCHAESETVTLEIRNHLFNPAEVYVPANKKVKMLVTNQDATPEEFESYELNREKVIMGNSKTVIFIGPLPAGQYPFFGEFNPKTAQGMVIAK